MTIKKRLTRYGNSDDKTLLQVPDGASIVFTPLKSKVREKRFSASLKKINQKYGKVLKKLAE
jgi:hypothetical protein